MSEEEALCWKWAEIWTHHLVEHNNPEWDDFLSMALQAAVEACRTWNGASSKSTWLSTRIKGELKTAFRNRRIRANIVRLVSGDTEQYADGDRERLLERIADENANVFAAIEERMEAQSAPDMISTGECALMKGCSPKTVASAVRNGHLRGVKVGARHMIERRDAEAWKPALSHAERGRMGGSPHHRASTVSKP